MFYEMVDLDYWISEEDDDLYADNVDEDGEKIKKNKMKGKEKLDHDGNSKVDDMWVPELDEEKVDFKFKSF